MEYQEAFKEHQEAFVEYQESFMEYQEAWIEYQAAVIQNQEAWIEYQSAISNTGNKNLFFHYNGHNSTQNATFLGSEEGSRKHFSWSFVQ